MKYKKPTLLVDKEKALNNINRIVKKAKESGTEVWPHFKTHQSLEIGRWFKSAGIDGITVSSVSMASYFAADGWQNIYIAFPANINEIEEIGALASTVNLTLLVNEEIHIEQLSNRVKTPVKLKIEIETGANRSGIPATEKSRIASVIDKIQTSQHEFNGFYSHFGHTYRAANTQDVFDIYNQAYSTLDIVQHDFSAFSPGVSLGDTPSASVLESYSQFSSIHAGNYVFYDLTQAQIGVCDEDDIAIALAAPIVSKNPERLELVVYGGGIHLSKEKLHSREFNEEIFGKIVTLGETGWSKSLSDCYVRAISQEHGVIRVNQNIFDQFSVGDSLGILPVHSCMTADCMALYYSMEGTEIDHFQSANKGLRL